MRCLITLIGFSVAGVVSASYDMMLLPGADGRVHRYDPANRVQLGSYNADFNALSGLTIDQPTRRTVAYGSRVRLHNFDTGQHQYSFAQPSPLRYMHFDQSQNRMIALLNSNIVRQLDPLTGAVFNTTVLPTGANQWYTAMTYRNTMTFVGYNLSGFVHYASMDMSTFVLSAVTATTFQVSNVAGFSQGVIGTTNHGATVTGGFVGRRNSGGGAWTYFNMTFNSQGRPTGMGGQIDLLNFDATQPQLALGHDSIYAVGGDAANSAFTRINQFDMLFNPAMMGNWSERFSTTFTQASQIANVVAPEPGSLGVLAFGGWMILRRRGSHPPARRPGLS